MRRILETRELTLPEVKALLEQRASEAELDRIQHVTLDYVIKFCKIDPDAARELRKELKDGFNLSQFAIIQIINIMPETIEELRTLLIREEKTLSTEELKEILRILDKYRRKE